MTQTLSTNAATTIASDFGEGGALRRTIGETGRVHVDRWLPFLIVHRGGGDPDSLARRIAINSPAYLVWDESDDATALPTLDAVVTRIAQASGPLLVISIADDLHVPVAHDSPQLPSLVATVLADNAGGADRAGTTIAKALGEIEIDLRHCKVHRADFAPLLPTAFDRMLAGIDGVERLAIIIPPIHRRPDGGIYPAIADAMITSVVDAILRSACAFLDDSKGKAPAHYRSLGRSAYLAAALKADRQLSEIQSRFDFLLSISPINTSSAMEDFLASEATREPKLYYRPLTVDPDAAKRDLYAIDLSSLEDPTLERLLAGKRRELDAQLTMLATRNTPSFRAASMFLYGAVESDLLADAETILASTAKDPSRGEIIVADDIVAGANALIDQYRIFTPFDAVVEKRNDVSGLMVSGNKLYVGADSIMPKRRLRALLAHEVSVHLLTYCNGAAQGLGLFRNGLAGYEGVQEGLGVFAEWAVGGLTRTRLRLLAGRVVAVDAMLAGANFIDCWNVLHRDHGFTRRGAFGITARVFRSGGLAKDAIYLQGLRTVLQLVVDGAPLDPFWLGKIAVDHIPAIEELLQRKLARPPAVLPAFLADADTSDRIARLRTEGSIRPVLLGDQNP